MQFCGIEFYVSDFENYFIDDYQHCDTITKLSINTKIRRKLNKRVIKTVPKKTSRYFFREDLVTVFEIKLSDFLKSGKNYALIREIGMESYIYNIVRKVKEIIEIEKPRTASNMYHSIG